MQALPIQLGMLGLKPEFPHELDKARDGQGVAVDDIAAIRVPSPQFRTTLNAQLEEAGKCSVAGRKRLLRSFCRTVASQSRSQKGTEDEIKWLKCPVSPRAHDHRNRGRATLP